MCIKIDKFSGERMVAGAGRSDDFGGLDFDGWRMDDLFARNGQSIIYANL